MIGSRETSMCLSAITDPPYSSQDFISAPLTVQLRDVMRETFNEFNRLQGPMGGPHASRRFAKTTSARAFVAEKSQVVFVEQLVYMFMTKS